MNTPFEKRICLTICICQLTAVLSCVSIVYLTVAVYVPSYKLMNSGFSEKTVMCTTVSNLTIANCELEEGAGPSWSSCGEWCLSKSSGSCTQIRVDVRRNGSNIRLEGCDHPDTIYCDGIDPKKKVYECINGECGTLHGIFNCSKGVGSGTGEIAGARCRNLTSVLSCNLTTTDAPILCNSKKACLALDGLYECTYGNCARVRPPFKCEKRCIGIKTGGKNVVIRQGDVIFTANCSKAVAVPDAPLAETEIWSSTLKSEEDPERHSVLMMFCTTLIDDPDDKKTFKLTDCFNSTLLAPGHFGNTTNITHLVQSHYDATEVLRGDLAPPPETDLLIFNSTPLYINFDACVNSLILDECAKFHAEYGGDGNDFRTQSRFQCYHQPNSSEFVVARFSRLRSLMELMVASTIPITLAVVSCFTLILCTRIIHVGDDSHFYFQFCGADAKAALEQEAVEAMAL